MRMPRESREVVLRVVVAKVIEEQKRIVVFRVAESERSAELNACAFHRRTGLNDASYCTDGHGSSLPGSDPSLPRCSGSVTIERVPALGSDKVQLRMRDGLGRDEVVAGLTFLQETLRVRRVARLGMREAGDERTGPIHALPIQAMPRQFLHLRQHEALIGQREISVDERVPDELGLGDGKRD